MGFVQDEKGRKEHIMNANRIYRIGIGIFALILLLSSVPAGAGESRTWVGPANGDWHTRIFWDSPGYDESDWLTVLDGSPTSSADVCADNGGWITLDGLNHSVAADFGSYDLKIGIGGQAVLDVENGATLSNRNCYAANNPYNYGTAYITVSGTGSTWTNTGVLRLGEVTGAGSQSTLDITYGGKVSNTDGYIERGTVTVSGAGAEWYNSGNLYLDQYVSESELTIEVGGEVRVDGELSVSYGSVRLYGGTMNVGSFDNSVGGTFTHAGGTLTVDGGAFNPDVTNYTLDGADNPTVKLINGASMALTSELTVGNNDTGTLNINDGGTVENTIGYIGRNSALSSSTGTVTVSGAGSTWTNREVLYVGNYGMGTLNINAGGTVTNAMGCIGYGANSSGNVTVNGAGATWSNSSSLIVGESGTSTLNITNGGSVTNTNGCVGALSGSEGTVMVSGDGATWINSGDLLIADNGTGTLTIRPGGTVSIGGELNVDTGGTVNVNGGAIRFARPNPLIVNGAFNFNAGTLGFDCDLDVVSGSSDLVNQVFEQGGSIEISHSNCLDVTSSMTLLMNTNLDGGTLSVGSLWGADYLNFNSGTFKLTDAGLTVNTNGLFGRTLGLNADQTVEVTNEATVASTGTLQLEGGTFSAGTTTNFGEIQLNSGSGGVAALLGGGQVDNYGFINAIGSGSGRISANLNNTATGQISVGAGGELLLTGSVNDNYGTIINSGGTLGATSLVTNHALAAINSTGQVTLSLNGGLNNSATVSFDNAQADVYGDMTNNAGALVALANTSDVSFIGAFVNIGDVYVGADSKATFYGDVCGSGNFTGSGTAEFTGKYTPGCSPAAVSFGGDVILAGSSGLEIELGGINPGTEHDALNVAGKLTLNSGTLDVVLIDGFSPVGGETFDILDWDSLTGEFDANNINLPGLSGGLYWDTSDLYDSGEISVTPEPATAVLLLSGGVLVILRRRRR